MATRQTKSKKSKKVIPLDTAKIELDTNKVIDTKLVGDMVDLKDSEILGDLEVENPEVIEERIKKLAEEASSGSNVNQVMFDQEPGQEFLNQEGYRPQPEVSEPESQASNLSAAADRVPEQANNGVFDDSMEQIISTVVNKLSTTLQSLCVSERVIAAQSSANDWKEICKLMIANPEVINEKLSISRGPNTLLRQIGVDMSDPSKVTLAQFLASPLSTPLWRIISMFEITQFDPLLEKWWRNIKVDSKDPWTKLNKYIQAMNYFITVSDTLWSTLSINPTVWSVQKIITYITACGDWLRSAKLDHYRWADRYYRAAESIALAEKTGANIFKFLEELWPCGLKGHLVHYNGRPFETVRFYPTEDIGDCVIAPYLKNFKFDPSKAWPEEEVESSESEEEPTPKRKPKRKSTEDMHHYEEESDDDLPKPFNSQFKFKKRKLN